jgi:glycosyltransferase involved in cell wall biosynthesis
MNKPVVPIAAVIPTRNRAASLGRLLESLKQQGIALAELIVVDASADTQTRDLVAAFEKDPARGDCRVMWLKAEQTGAAVQRNQGIARASQPVIGFFDDDIVFQPQCLQRLWQAMNSDPSLGGVNAMITNQRYLPPGLVSRALFCVLAGSRSRSYAGRVLGPAVNLLPEDDDGLPEVVPVEWLNLGATLYRREALPDPVFRPFFTGYSMLEDLALSSEVGKRWTLANVRTARIDHDSQPADHKADAAAMGRMELANRHYIMTRILERRRLADYAKLALWEIFQSAVGLVQKRGGPDFWRTMYGRMMGVRDIIFTGDKPGRGDR